VLTALINIHHYVLDGATWKLRDGRIARLLISKEGPSAASPPPALPHAARWGSFGRGLAWAAVASVALAAFATETLRGYMLLQAGTLREGQKWQDAKAFYRGAMRYNGRTADAMEGLAIADMVAGNLEQAAEHWLESIRLNPISAHLFEGLGETYMKLGRLDEALEQLEHTVSLAPRDEVGLRLLARAHSLKGNQERAQALVERADAVASEEKRQGLAL